MRRILSTFIVFLLLIPLCGTSAATIVTPWYEPAGLSAGDQYQLSVVTNRLTYATSFQFEYYRDVVELDMQGTELEPFSWSPIVSVGTKSVELRANVGAVVSGPVYNTNGQLLAINYDEFWSSTLKVPIAYNNQGNLSQATMVWTGTDYMGNNAGQAYLGTEVVPYIAVFGDPRMAGETRMLAGSAVLGTMLLPIYALSEPITAVPLPGAVWLLGAGLGGVGLVRRKIKR